MTCTRNPARLRLAACPLALCLLLAVGLAGGCAAPVEPLQRPSATQPADAPPVPALVSADAPALPALVSADAPPVPVPATPDDDGLTPGTVIGGAPADSQFGQPRLTPSAHCEETMPGSGAMPPQGEPAARRAAGRQAAMAVAVYHVTKQINDKYYKDKIENGWVYSDHYAYHAGLEVKSQTAVIGGQITLFEIWLIVPPGKAGGQDKLQLHVRDFVLQGPPLTQAQIDRVLAAAGGYVVVTRIEGPDDKGLFKAEVGRLRRPG